MHTATPAVALSVLPQVDTEKAPTSLAGPPELSDRGASGKSTFFTEPIELTAFVGFCLTLFATTAGMSTRRGPIARGVHDVAVICAALATILSLVSLLVCPGVCFRVKLGRKSRALQVTAILTSIVLATMAIAFTAGANILQGERSQGNNQCSHN